MAVEVVRTVGVAALLSDLVPRRLVEGRRVDEHAVPVEERSPAGRGAGFGHDASVTSTERPSRSADRGTRLPSTRLPSSFISRTPRQEEDGLFTRMFSFLPRNTRCTSKPGQWRGMQGSMRRPSTSGTMPRMLCTATNRLHEAVPVSHGTRDLPALGLTAAYVVWLCT